jgi:hypothetical protein
MPGKGPDFSTSFWKEFKLRYPRPEVYIGALLPYVAVLIVSLAPGKLPPSLPLVLGVVVSLSLAMAAACSGSRSFSSRRWLARLGRSAIKGRVSVSEIRGQWLQAMVPCLLAVAILLPLFGWCGLAAGRSSEDLGSGAMAGLLLFEMALSSVLVTGSVAARLSIGRGRGKVALVAICSFVVVGAIRGMGLTLVMAGLYSSESFPGVGMSRLAIHAAVVDGVICLFIASGLGMGLRPAVERALAQGKSDIGGDWDLIMEYPESFGLEVSFWSLLRWKFWADLLVRVERRSAWSWRGLICVWLLLLAWPWLMHYGLMQLFYSNYVVNIYGASYVFRFLVGLLRAEISWLIAPAIMVVGFCNQRHNGVLDTFLLTPVAPLRLVASKLFGMLWHVILPATISQVIIMLWQIEQLGDYHGVVVGVLLSSWMLYRGGLAVMAAGALGLYFAARCRTMMGALAWSYTSVVLWLHLHQWLEMALLEYLSSDLSSFCLLFAAYAVGLALFLRWAFPAIARRLVLGTGK